MRRIAIVAIPLLFAACAKNGGSTSPTAPSGDPTTPVTPTVDTRPANVAVVSGKFLANGVVELVLRTNGGPGFYYVEWYFGPAYLNVPGKSNPASFMLSTSTVTVDSTYSQTVDYPLSYNQLTNEVSWAKVYSRAAANGSAYTMTSCWPGFSSC